jgi:iron complex transport system ATP-binding protein
MALNIEIDDLRFSFGPQSHRLHDISLAVPDATMCCLLGPNGAGKTTLIRCLLGLLKPEGGVIRVAGKDAGSLSARQLARAVAYVPQTTTTIFPFSALEIAVMGRTPQLTISRVPSRGDRQLAQDRLDQLGIGHLAQRPFAQLSGGERQLTMLARALVQEAPVMVLDEPTAALDYGNEARILQVIAELVDDGPSVLMTTHQPNHALTWGHQAALMRGGAIVASGPPREIITSELLSELYEVPITVTRLPAKEGGGLGQWVCHPDIASLPGTPHRRPGEAGRRPELEASSPHR